MGNILCATFFRYIRVYDAFGQSEPTVSGKCDYLSVRNNKLQALIGYICSPNLFRVDHNNPIGDMAIWLGCDGILPLMLIPRNSLVRHAFCLRTTLSNCLSQPGVTVFALPSLLAARSHNLVHATKFCDFYPTQHELWPWAIDYLIGYWSELALILPFNFCGQILRLTYFKSRSEKDRNRLHDICFIFDIFCLWPRPWFVKD